MDVQEQLAQLRKRIARIDLKYAAARPATSAAQPSALRPARYYKPYSVTLQKFTHEKYAGTEIPKNFSSKVTLIDPERSVDRDVLIYMNHPLRYRGETFYQAGFQPDDSATILQVVHNPTFIAPYVACVIVAAGLLVQFGFHLVGFSRQRRGAVA